MKNTLLVLRNFIVMVSLFAGAVNLRAQGTAFTYQGRLTANGSAANGLYSLRFQLVQTSNGQPQGPVLTNDTVSVSNGLFTTVLDFGDYFGEREFALEIGVRTNGSAGAFTVLAPNSVIRPTPLAIAANHAASAGTVLQVPDVALSFNIPRLDGSPSFFAGPGVPPFQVGNTSKVANLNADLLDGLGAGAFWQLGGNSSTTPGTHFLGTTDNHALEIKVNGVRALRLEPATNGGGFNFPNLIGGVLNSVGAGQSGSTIAGGRENVLDVTHGTISGGWRHTIQTGSQDAAIGGGQNNSISVNAVAATIAGGVINAIGAGSQYATVGGGRFNRIGDNGVQSTISGGRNNLIGGNADNATIGGGEGNIASRNHSFIGGGSTNGAGSINSVIVGGANNGIADALNFLGGLQAFASGSFIGSGENNSISPRVEGSFPFLTYYDAFHAMIGGGLNNTISGGSYGAIPGGRDNTVAGSFGLAAGRRAKANHDGAFVWADSTDADFASTAANQFAVRATGGVQLDPLTSIHFGTQTRQMLNLWGTQYGIGVQSLTTYFRTDTGGGFAWFRGGTHNDGQNNPGGGTIVMRLDSNGSLFTAGAVNPPSDRNAKENFAAVKPRDVLEKVAALPITSWNYKQDTTTRHVGPMAQDFYAAFGVGPDDKHIATVDADGVALAAIQGLNQKLEEQVKAKDAEIETLKQRVEKLERMFE